MVHSLLQGSLRHRVFVYFVFVESGVVYACLTFCLALAKRFETHWSDSWSVWAVLT